MAILGKVISIDSQSEIVVSVVVDKANGERLPLQLNDTIDSGDTVVAPKGVIVELQLVNGKVIHIFSEQAVQITPELADVIPPSTGDSSVDYATIQTVIKAINDDLDIGEVLESSSAGFGLGGSSAGHSFVDLQRIIEALNPIGAALESLGAEELGIEVPFADQTNFITPGGTGAGSDSDATDGAVVPGGPVGGGPENTPVTADDLGTTDEDIVFNGDVSTNDTLSGDGGNTFSLTTNASNGTVVMNNDGTYTYTPNANFNGSDSFTYTLTDVDGDTSTATVNLTVNPIDDVPVTVDDTGSTDEDIVFNGDVSTNDTLSGDGGNTFSLTTNATNGTVVMNTDGTYTYTPNANFNGSDSFTYTLTDVDGDTSTATVNLTVNPINDVPVTVDDTGSTDEDIVFNGDVSTNDTLSGDGGNTFSLTTNASNGTVVMNTDGTYTYTPNANFNGTDSFTYTLTDVDGDTSTATVNLTVNPIDDIPVAVDDTDSTTEDTAVVITAASLLANDTDLGDGPVTITSVQAPVNGTVNLVGTDITFTPDANYSGPASFTYTITDADGDTSTATVNLTVNPIDDVPVTVDDTGVTDEDIVFNGDVSTNDTLSGDGGNTFSLTTNATNGTVVMNTDGTYTYTPNANFNGTDSFTYTLTDVDGDTSTATVNLTVNPVNDAPVAVDDSNNVPINGSAVGNVLTDGLADNDPDGDALTVISFTVAGDATVYQADNTGAGNTATITGVGVLTITTTGVYTFTPDFNYSGPIPVTTYTVSDGVLTDTGTLALTMGANNDPTATDDTAVVTEDIATSGNVLTDGTPDSDPDSNPLTVIGFTIDTNGDSTPETFTPGQNAIVVGIGTLTIAVNGAYTFTPLPDYNGPVPVATYTISDGLGGTDTASLTLGPVTPVDDLPVTVDDTGTTNEDNAFNGDVSTNDTLSGDGGNTFSLTTNATNGTVVMNTDGTYTYTPNANFNGADSFTYTLTDVDGDTSTATVNLTVNPIDDIPVAVDDTDSTTEDTAVVITAASLLANDTDLGDGPVTITSVQAPVNGTVNLVGTDITFTPDANYSGPASFTYTITDADGDTSTATVNLTVNPVDDVPVTVDDTGATDEDIVFNGDVSTNDTLSGDGGNTFSLTTNATNGTVVMNTDGTYTYTPNANFNGSDSFTYTLTDVDGDTSTATVNLTVNPIDDVPVTVDDTGATDEDIVFNGDVSTNDTLSGDGGNTFSLTTNATNGTVVMNTDGTYTYTPNANFNGSDSFTYTLTDVDGDTSTATVNLTVNPIDDVPVTVDDTGSTDEDIVFNGDVSTNDTLSGDGGNTFSLTTNATNGTVVMNTDGTYTYTPNANFNGTDSFTYTLTDVDGDTSTATVNLTVNPIDDVPVTVDDTGSTDEDIVFNGDVSTNDTLSGDGGNTFSLTTNATNGTVVMNTDGTYTYTPNANFNGSDSFTYTLTDVDGDTSTATVNLTVNPIDDVPVTVDDTGSTDEDIVFNGDVSTNDTLSGDGGNTFSLTTNATNGTVVMNTDGTYTYTPNANFNGTDSFTYTLTDVDGDTSTATVNLTVNPIDDVPVTVDDTGSTDEDIVFNGDVSTNDTLSGDGGNTFSLTTNATNGTVVMNTDGTYTYTPNANFNGADSFTYTLTDVDGDTSTATVNLTVNPINDVPVTVDDTGSTDEDIVFNGDVSTNDTLSGDGGNTFSLTTNATNGTVVMNTDGTYTYTPNANFNGTDSFTYTLTDVDGDTSTATVNLTVNPVNDVPVTVDDTGATDEDIVFNGDVSTNDTLSGDGGNTFSLTTNATNGTVVMNNDGTYTYTPNANFNGSDSFTYTLTDVDGDTSTATVNLTVNPIDDVPVTVDDTGSTDEDIVFNGDVSTNDTLSGDGGNTFSLSTNATNGTVVMNTDGTYTYTPNANFNGADSFTYTLTDVDGDTSTATVNLTVNPIDDVPVTVDDTGSTDEDIVFNGDVSTNDTLSGDGGNTFSLTTNATNGTVVMNTDGTYTYTPNANFNGTDSFTYTLTDVDGDTSTATVNLTVNPVNDVPVTVDDTGATDEDIVFNGDVSTNDTLSGDGGNTFSLTTNATNGTVVMNTDGTYTYTPNANFNGTDSFTYTLTDVDGDTSTATVNLTVNPIDDVPVTVDDTGSTDEDIVFNGDVSTNDTLSGDGGNTFSLTTNATNGTVVMNNDGTYTYTPNANFNGSDSFAYTLTDVDGDTSTATVNLTVNPIDDVPVTVDDTGSTDEDIVFNGDVSTNDTLSGDGGNTFSLTTNATNGTVVMNTDGTYTYTPNANFNGSDSFTYTLTDVDGDTSTATVNLTVNPIDDVPVTVDDTGATDEDIVFNGDVSTNDTLSGDGGNTFSLTTNATNGTVVMNNDGTYTYTPNANFNGSDSFTYTLTDVDGDTSTATVNLTVNPIDDVPVTVDDTGSTDEDIVFNGDVSTNDTLSGDGGNTFSLSTNATNGTVVMNTDGTYTYTPNANFNGADSFTYTLTDVDGDTSTATVNLTVNPIDDVPVTVDDTGSTDEDIVFNGDVSTNDTLSGDGGNTFSLTTNATNGTVVMNTDGTYTYTPNANFNGTDSFTYTLTDVDGDTSTATVNLTVNPVNDVPVTVDDTGATDEDIVFNGDVSTNDTLSGDGGNTFSLTTNATNGTVVMNTDGTYTYTPNANFNGTDSFTYTLTDVDGDTSTATVNLTVNPIDDVPVTVDDTGSTDEDIVFNGDVSTNDTLSGDGGNTFSLTTNATNGTVVMNNDGTYTYTPNANFNGSDSFAYTLTDVDGDTSTATVNLTVNPIDDVPVTVDDTGSTDEDIVFNGDVSTNDTLSGDGGNTFSLTTNATNGTVVMNTDGTYTYTPNANFNGSDSFTYTLTDVDGDTSTATVNLTVNPIDDVPVTVDDTGSTDEDIVFNGDVSTNDTLSGDGGNTFSLTTNATNGTVVMNNDGTYTYTPNANFNGSDSFAYTLTDVDGDTSTATVNLTVNPIDDVPVTVDDTGSTDEDIVFNGDVSTNDTLSGDGGNTFSLTTNATNGTVVMNTDGTYTYTPNANFNGSDSFTYTLTDVDGDTSTATVNLTVNPIDDVPVTVDDTGATDEDIVFNGDVSTNDTLSGDGGNTFSLTTNATNGTVVMNTDGTYTYTPNANFNGADSFTYTLTDVDGDTSTATVNLTVNPIDDVPVAVDDTDSTTEDTAVVITAASLLANDTDLGDGPVTITSVQAPVNGTVNLVGTDITFTPDANYSGPASFTYTITDADGDTSTATVNLTVNPIDDVPVTVDDTGSTDEDIVFNGDVSTNDTLSGDGGNTFSLTTNATNGTVVMNTDGTYTYTPNANFNGSDSFTYTLTDVDGDTSTATVNLTVNPIDDVPVTVDDTGSTDEDIVFNGDVSTNDTLSGDGGNTFSLTTNATNGTVVMNTDGTYTYTPNANFNGSDSFTYTLTDVDGDTSTATVNLTVNPIDDVPVTVDDTGATDEDIVFNGDVSTNDTLSGDGGNTFSLTTNATNGTVVMNTDGTYTYTPNANFNGTDSFTYTLTDVDGDTSTATVNLTVNPIDDVPVTVDDTGSTDEDIVFNGDVSTNDTLSGDGGNTFSLTTNATNGTVVMNTDGTYTYTPNANFNGSDSFTYTLTDVDGDTSTATVNLTVNPIDDIPVAVDDTDSTTEDTAVVITAASLLANDTDLGDGPVTITSVQAPVNGTVNLVGTDITFTPDANYSGPASFTYTITDADGDTSTATVDLTIVPVADEPLLAIDDTITGGATAASPASPSGLLLSYYQGLNNNDRDAALQEGVIDIAAATSQSRVATGFGTPETGPLDRNVSGSTININTGDAYSITGLIYLEAGSSYVFSGYVDDSARLEVGGQTLYTSTGNTWGDFNTVDGSASGGSTPGGAFVPANDGYYTLEFFANNVSGPGQFSLNLAVDGGATQVLDFTNFDIYASVADIVDGGGQFGSFIPGIDNPDGGYLPLAVNSGALDSYIEISNIAVTLQDTDGSEEVDSVLISAIPVGATITDGVNTFTAATGNTAVDVKDWDMDAISILPPSGFTGDIILTVTAASREIANGDISNTVSDTITVTVIDVSTSAIDPDLLDVPILKDNVAEVFEDALPTGSNSASPAEVVTGNILADDTLPGNAQLTNITIAGGTTAITAGLITVTTAEGNTLEVNNDANSAGFGDYTYTLVNAVAPNSELITPQTFDGNSLEGWAGAGVSNVGNQLRIGRDNTANQTFDFGTDLANETVTINFDLTVSGGWETAGGAQDFFRVVANGVEVSTTSPVNNSTTSISVNVTLDANGQVVLGLTPDTTGGGEVASIDNFVIEADLAITSVNEVVDQFTYTVTGDDGFNSTAVLDVTVHDDLVGTSADEYITGTDGDDLITGGAGDDFLTGGLGADVFKWSLGDEDTAGSPAFDLVSDFSIADGDALDLRDLLVGESSTAAVLDNYLHFEFSGGDTTMYISSTGVFGDNNVTGAPSAIVTNNTEQNITFTGVDLVGGLTSDFQVIQNLLSNGNLIVD